MINAIEWFKEKGFTYDDKITIKDVIDLQNDALEDAAHTCDMLAGEMLANGQTAHFCAKTIRGNILKPQIVENPDRCWKCKIRPQLNPTVGLCAECNGLPPGPSNPPRSKWQEPSGLVGHNNLKPLNR